MVQKVLPQIIDIIWEKQYLQRLLGYAGYNSIGIISSGGAGMALAQWINDGSPPFDLWEVDIRRAEPFQINRNYLRERVTESLGYYMQIIILIFSLKQSKHKTLSLS